MLNHIDAFETHLASPIDYSGFTYPSAFSGLVFLGEHGLYNTSFDRDGIRRWLGWRIGSAPCKVLRLYLLGSLLESTERANDIDIAMLLDVVTEETTYFESWFKNISSESNQLFELPLHASIFKNPDEKLDFEAFIQKCVRKAPSNQSHPLLLSVEPLEL
jgi:hypothetical protein